jgi:hypothetical protein
MEATVRQVAETCNRFLQDAMRSYSIMSECKRGQDVTDDEDADGAQKECDCWQREDIISYVPGVNRLALARTLSGHVSTNQ